MSSIEVRYRLKKPLLVYLLAICFIAAPFCNIIASMLEFGVRRWYSPHVFLAFVQNTNWLDRTWLLLTLLGGIALLHSRKWSWLVAIAALLASSIFNLVFAVEFGGKLTRGTNLFPYLFTLWNVAIVVVLYHFRFPYLDRRDAWWGIYPRYRCRLPVSSGEFKGTITNISKSGAFIAPDEGCSPIDLRMGKLIKLRFGPFEDLEAEVVHNNTTGVGLEFLPTPEQFKQIEAVVQKQQRNKT